MIDEALLREWRSGLRHAKRESFGGGLGQRAVSVASDSREATAGVDGQAATSAAVVRERRGPFRTAFESLLCLSLAVLLFRTFIAEGYLISTGSMAPCLLGYHLRVECPTCGHHFPFGVAYDTDDGDDAEAVAGNRARARCPNCGQSSIDVTPLIRNHGDQLLVAKLAYEYRDPRRWEVVVFRNPVDPSEAYVKRVAGLPGERIQIVDGDVYANGELCRKNLRDQYAMRVLVHDYTDQPNQDAGFQPHWQPMIDPDQQEPEGAPVESLRGSQSKGESPGLARHQTNRPPRTIEQTSATGGAGEVPPERLPTTPPGRLPATSEATPLVPEGDNRAGPVSIPLTPLGRPGPVWEAKADGFELAGSDSAAKTRFSWVAYHAWVRAHGGHQTTVVLEAWPGDVDYRTIPNAAINFDYREQRLSCIGALSADVFAVMTARTRNTHFLEAVRALYDQSHRAPVADQYGYNPTDASFSFNPVRDLMWSGRVHAPSGQGTFAVEMTDGGHLFRLELDYGKAELRLYADGGAEPVLGDQLPSAVLDAAAVVEMSLIDQQVLVAVNHHQVLPRWTFERREGTEPPRQPVRFGARGLQVRVNELRLYRDVYYTGERCRHAVDRPYELPNDAFFMLGDNSPVSHDSRRWVDPAVDRELLIGKPFLVHLPSKPGQIQVAGREMLLRLPDWERVRFLP